MSNQDHEAKARELLPCHRVSCGVDDRWKRFAHYSTCPANYRSAVAAALAAAEAKGAEERIYDEVHKAETHAVKMQYERDAAVAEIAQLKKRLGEL